MAGSAAGLMAGLESVTGVMADLGLVVAVVESAEFMIRINTNNLDFDDMPATPSPQ